jgi:hypothetical protein
VKLSYAKGSYIAFLDPEELDESKPEFKVGRVIKDVKEDDQTFMCDVYTLTKNLTYKLHKDKHQIADRTVVSEIAEVSPISEKKGKLAESLKITRVQYNKIQKLVPNVAKALEVEESQQTESEHTEEPS